MISIFLTLCNLYLYKVQLITSRISTDYQKQWIKWEEYEKLSRLSKCQFKIYVNGGSNKQHNFKFLHLCITLLCYFKTVLHNLYYLFTMTVEHNFNNKQGVQGVSEGVWVQMYLSPFENTGLAGVIMISIVSIRVVSLITCTRL